MNWIAIAIAAGAAAALLFTTAISVTTAFTLLFFFAPLPLLIAGLGYGLAVALVGGLAGVVALAAAMGSVPAALFAASAALPAALVVRLALLSRDAGGTARQGETAGDGREWYPEGRILIAIALLAATLTAVLLVSLGPGIDQYRAAMGQVIDAMVSPQQPAGVSPEQVAQVKSLLLSLFPFAAAAGWTAITFANFRLALEIVRQARIGARPPVRFGAMTFPRSSLVLLAAALLASFLAGMPGLIGLAASGAMLIAFAILGLAVLHGLLEGHSMRRLLLAALYVAILILGFLPVLPLVALAVLDMAMGLRARAAATPPGTGS
jgi:hypothetical protein